MAIKNSCYFCGSDDIILPEIGIAFGMAGYDLSFCRKCLASMTAEKFWNLLFDLQGYTWPPALNELKKIKL